MAKLNMIIRAFDPTELTFLHSLVEREIKELEKNGKLPTPIGELSETISRAFRYVDGLDKQEK